MNQFSGPDEMSAQESKKNVFDLFLSEWAQEASVDCHVLSYIIQLHSLCCDDIKLYTLYNAHVCEVHASEQRTSILW